MQRKWEGRLYCTLFRKIRGIIMLKAVMFGAGGGGKRLYSLVKEKYEIVGIVDNDKRKLGTNFYNLKVEEPKMLLEKIYDRVVLTCVPGKDSIIEQLRQYGITEDNIDMSLINQPLESRRIFLKNFAKQYGGGITEELQLQRQVCFKVILQNTLTNISQIENYFYLIRGQDLIREISA